MFYSQFILAKNGPLGTIWIAAHLERKLRKNQVADTDIGVSVDSILFPEVPIALRLSSHLLLGVVRIYSRKVNYLFDDCSEALLKVRQAFRSTAVDLPPEESKAPYHSITLPETFDLDDFELPDTDVFQGNFVDHHVSSKDQITLQDTMEGMVYSTSQFGLDERFGDGDTSQIGLDLDEELLLEKGASSGHEVLLSSHVDPQTSAEPSSSQKGDVANADIDYASEAAPANTTLQGPATPGLLEEPNLPSEQEAQVSEDHMEEDQNLIEPIAKEVSDIAHRQLESTADVASVCADVIKVSKDLDVVSVQDDSMSKSEPNGAVADQSKGVCGEAQVVGLNGTLAPSHLSHKDADNLPDKASVNGFCTSVFESSVIDKSSDLPRISTSVEADKETENSSLKQADLVQKTLESRVEDPEILNHDSTDNMESAGGPLLRACNSHSDHANGKEAPGVSLAEVQEVIDPTMNNGQALDTAPCEVDEDPSEVEGEVENVISEDVQKEKESSALVSDLPSPEKLLSLPDVPIGQSTEFLIGLTPEKEALAEGDQDISMNKVSGKKRSFTESTVTLQSLNSVESSEAAQSKRSVEFMPDDDDLLSSILVGRRATALKMKPTPSASELVSSKRQRVASRSGAHKRKALMDDSMVLHGDTIREQLVNTKDIRRVRKKAPSTRPEIWILQKQFLEGVIFSEPLFSGMSTELIWLHSQPFDLNGMKRVQDEGSKSQSTVTDGIGSTSRITVGEHIEFDGTSMPSVARDGGDEQSLEVSVEPGAIIASELDDGTALTMRITDGEPGNKKSQISIPEEKTEMEIDKPASVGVEADQPLTLEAGLSIGGTCERLDEQCTGKNILNDTNTGDRDIVEQRSGGQLTVRTEVDSAVATTSSLTDSVLPVHDENTIGATSLECGGLELASDQVLKEGRSDWPRVLNEDEVHSSNARCDNKSLALGCLPEGLELGSLPPVEGDLGLGNAILVEGAPLEAVCQIPADAATTTASNCGVLEQFGDVEPDVDEHDTGFLNFDDDEIAEEDDNSMANAEETGILDNSGWSARTRAVANYLQTLFLKDAQHGRKALHLDNLLAGKSRKEASRMFFETLVLKTRDYIHAEQEDPFGSISVKPRVKLMKSEF